MDRFNEISAFIAVVEAAGFSAAARRTGESQSAMSKAVGALEKRLGVRLFNRSTRSVTLTDQGQKYYDRMKPLLEEVDTADSELTNSLRRVAGIVRIAAPSTFGRLHILPLIPALLTRYSALKIDLILSDFLRDMVEDRIDMAIRVSPVTDPDTVVRRLASTSLVCVGARSYFDLNGRPAHPNDLAHHNCLVYGNMTAWPFTGPQGRFSTPVTGSLSSNSVETIRAGVLAGVGIGMFHKASLVAELQTQEVLTVLDEFTQESRDINVIWPKRRFVSARVRLVTDYFAATLPARL